MTKAQKVLLGIGAVASVATAVYIVNKKTEKLYADLTEESAEDEKKEDSDISKIKAAADKKCTEILAWVITHREQIEAASMILGVAGASLSIINSVREYRRGNETADKINEIYDWIGRYSDVWNKYTEDSMNNLLEMVTYLENLDIKKK